jgi:hypothetical protein
VQNVGQLSLSRLQRMGRLDMLHSRCTDDSVLHRPKQPLSNSGNEYLKCVAQMVICLCHRKTLILRYKTESCMRWYQRSSRKKKMQPAGGSGGKRRCSRLAAADAYSSTHYRQCHISQIIHIITYCPQWPGHPVAAGSTQFRGAIDNAAAGRTNLGPGLIPAGVPNHPPSANPPTSSNLQWGHGPTICQTPTHQRDCHPVAEGGAPQPPHPAALLSLQDPSPPPKRRTLTTTGAANVQILQPKWHCCPAVTPVSPPSRGSRHVKRFSPLVSVRLCLVTQAHSRASSTCQPCLSHICCWFVLICS